MFGLVSVPFPTMNMIFVEIDDQRKKPLTSQSESLLFD